MLDLKGGGIWWGRGGERGGIGEECVGAVLEKGIYRLVSTLWFWICCSVHVFLIFSIALGGLKDGTRCYLVKDRKVSKVGRSNFEMLLKKSGVMIL